MKSNYINKKVKFSKNSSNGHQSSATYVNASQHDHRILPEGASIKVLGKMNP